MYRFSLFSFASLLAACFLPACPSGCEKNPPTAFAPPELPKALPPPLPPVSPEAAEAEEEAMGPLLREPSMEEFQALGIVLSPKHEEITKAFHEALNTLGQRELKALAIELERLSTENPWHFLAESASFAAIASWQALGECESILKAGLSFVQAWPQGAYAPEVWLYMAFCQQQVGQRAEFEETLRFIAEHYPHMPAGPKARIELGLPDSVNRP
ncbi:MAG: hypothetical protein FWG75_04725 [Cystobacterineae bacterium]|nr:hypothetical protein [Cystobacterineae bacterium]